MSPREGKNLETEKIVLPSLDDIWANLPEFLDQTEVIPAHNVAATAPPQWPNRATKTEVVSPRRLPTRDQLAPAIKPETSGAGYQLGLAERPRARQRPAPRPDLSLIAACRQADRPLPSAPLMIMLDFLIFFGTALTLGGFACLAHLSWG